MTFKTILNMQFIKKFMLLIVLTIISISAPINANSDYALQFVEKNSDELMKVQNSEEAKKWGFGYLQGKFGQVTLGGKVIEWSLIEQTPALLKKANEIAGPIGDVLTAYNLCNFIYNDQDPEAMVTVVKTSYSKALGLIAWNGLKRSLLVVDIIDYALSSALQEMTKDYQEFWKGYYYHYFYQAPYTRQYWFEKFKEGGYEAIQSELLSFWRKPGLLEEATEYGQDTLGFNQGLPITYRDAYVSSDEVFQKALAVSFFKERIETRLRNEIQENIARKESELYMAIEDRDRQFYNALEDHMDNVANGDLSIRIKNQEWVRYLGPITDLVITLKTAKETKTMNVNDSLHLNGMVMPRGQYVMTIKDNRSSPYFIGLSKSFTLPSKKTQSRTIVEVNICTTFEGQKVLEKAIKEREDENRDIAVGMFEVPDNDYSTKYKELAQDVVNLLDNMTRDLLAYERYQQKIQEIERTYQEYLETDKKEYERLNELSSELGRQGAARSEHEKIRKQLKQIKTELTRKNVQKVIDKAKAEVRSLISKNENKLTIIVNGFRQFLDRFILRSNFTPTAVGLNAIRNTRLGNTLSAVDYETKITNPALKNFISNRQKLLSSFYSGSSQTQIADFSSLSNPTLITSLENKRVYFQNLENDLEEIIKKTQDALDDFTIKYNEQKRKYTEKDLGAKEQKYRAIAYIKMCKEKLKKLPNNDQLYLRLIQLEKRIQDRMSSLETKNKNIKKKVKSLMSKNKEFQNKFIPQNNGPYYVDVNFTPTVKKVEGYRNQGNKMRAEYRGLKSKFEGILGMVESVPAISSSAQYKFQDLEKAITKSSYLVEEFDQNLEVLEKIIKAMEERRQGDADRAREDYQNERERRRQRRREENPDGEQQRRRDMEQTRNSRILEVVGEYEALLAQEETIAYDVERVNRFFQQAVAKNSASAYKYYYLAAKDFFEESEMNMEPLDDLYRALSALGGEARARKISNQVKDLHDSILKTIKEMEETLKPLVPDPSMIGEDQGYRLPGRDIDDIEEEGQNGGQNSDAQYLGSTSMTIANSQELDFIAGSVVSGDQGDILLFNTFSPRFECVQQENAIQDMGMSDFNIAPVDTSSYDGLVNVVAGHYYAVITRNNNFGKIHIISVTSTTVTLEWWYQSNGSPRF
jgi:DNA repair exonuclease SbcCD ATPase subunit